ncbi:dolichyl-phosphate beta-glucosyltransferase [Trichonephila clavipes]|nr:dolichyl-phosphate beta-glucosyltransferase [Trichonephila clavipes]
MADITRHEEEKFYLDLSTEPPSKKLFPKLCDESSVYLSVIVPAYNEENRLPAMLDECLEYLENRRTRHTDFPMKRCSSTGYVECAWQISAFADADGATKFNDIVKLEKEILEMSAEDSNSIVIGSRAHLEKDAIASRSFFRTILMYGFHFLVWLFAVRTVRDTQCGFKMFTRESARSLFYVLHVERWAFDVELLYIAEKKKMNIKEIAVNWTEIEGSKLVPFWSWLQMGIDLILIWLKYQTRIWKISDFKKES